MEDNYTPDESADMRERTKEVRYAYATRMAPAFDDLRYAEFDRWLAEVRREAWDEGHEIGREVAAADAVSLDCDNHCDDATASRLRARADHLGALVRWESKTEAAVTPTRFRKRPVVVEAVQFDGTSGSASHIIEWIGMNGGAATRRHAMRVSEGFTIETPEGTMSAQPGDWIIRGVQGEFYPCKPDIFAATYVREASDD